MAGYRPGDPFSRIIRYLGLTTNFQLCLDAGDIASYSSGQQWLDTSGGGFNYFLGTSGGVGADDPTFTGTPGNLSANEYWACNASSVFTYTTSNATWMNSLHKDGATYTILSWIYLTSYGAGSSQCVMGTLGNAGTPNVGMQFQVNTTTGVLRIQVSNGTGSPDSFVSTGAAVGLSGFHLVGVTINENGGASGGQFYVDGVANGAAFNPNYSSPSAAAASFAMQIAADGNSIRPLGLNGAARMGFTGMWTSVLTAAQILAFYNYSAPFIEESPDHFMTERLKRVVAY